MTTNELKAIGKALDLHNFEELYADACDMVKAISKEVKVNEEAKETIKETIKKFEYIADQTICYASMMAIIDELKVQLTFIDKELERLENSWTEQGDIIASLEAMDDYTYYRESF